MGIIEDLGSILDPVAAKLNQTIASNGVFLHSKLDSIEEAIRQSSAADWQDNWFRINIRRKLKVEQIELAEVPANEIWIVQYIISSGIEKSAEAVIEASGSPVFAIAKESNINFFPGGDIVFLPGETITIRPTSESGWNLSIGVIRRKIPARPLPQQSRENAHVQGRNLHDPERDVITSKTGVYVDTPRETESVDPTKP